MTTASRATAPRGQRLAPRLASRREGIGPLGRSGVARLTDRGTGESMPAMEIDKGRFDRWAPSYDRSVFQRLIFGPVHQAALKACLALSESPRDLLDVGCGTGRLLEIAGEHWDQVRCTGIDPSERMLAEAQRKHQGDARYTFKQGDAGALPLESASFDVVFSTMSFHHWGDQARGIREVARVLRPRGLFILADLDVPFLSLLRPLLQRTEHVRMQGPEEIARLCQEAGLLVLARHRFWPLVRAQLLIARKP